MRDHMTSSPKFIQIATSVYGGEILLLSLIHI